MFDVRRSAAHGGRSAPHAVNLRYVSASKTPTMTGPPSFLVIDHNAESRFMLVNTLRRKFPGAHLFESDDAEHALNVLRTGEISLIITHRTFDYQGFELVELLRRVAPTLPIVMVSGFDREAGALAAGANRFLHYDEWLRIGTVAEELLPPNHAPSRDVVGNGGGGNASAPEARC
jgi:CheY-like chemotaxis protein